MEGPDACVSLRSGILCIRLLGFDLRLFPSIEHIVRKYSLLGVARLAGNNKILYILFCFSGFQFRAWNFVVYDKVIKGYAVFAVVTRH